MQQMMPQDRTMTRALLIFALLAPTGSLAQTVNGTVAGRLLTGDGQPAVGVRVSVRSAPDVGAPAANETLVSIGLTDGDGRYRLSDIPPGRYHVTAGLVEDPTYFPGVSSKEEATAITLTAGTLLTQIDFTLVQPLTQLPSQRGSPLRATAPPVPQPAPEFTLKNVRGGEVKSTDLKGKVLVLEIWATWAVPAKEAVPEYHALLRQLKDQGLEVVAVTYDSGTEQDIAAVATQLQMEYPVVVGTPEFDQAFGGHMGLPMTLIIGKDWQIYRKILGRSRNKAQDLETEVRMLLAK
jgi:peroxiredoxin